ncbi:hypothetical protein QBC33DRAFT_606649 [Phialemonium atrogriseum]|uniref:Uncharacterized protein n=1 Tax=Phialemonium atrogriseum TaxID=1093897 RepID=A0AAJ0C4L0_9PEZI|nr:uncharacterized protein QBC33DRAFT_606649 [Phialemonium atrogriseum]KAK1769008.1 hypothetical protein QBC33DRAFT_606649 [Phialemonium atrogriseum]
MALYKIEAGVIYSISVLQALPFPDSSTRSSCFSTRYKDPPPSTFWNLSGILPLSKDDSDAGPGNYHISAVNATGSILSAQIPIGYWLQSKIEGNLLFVAHLSAYLPTRHAGTVPESRLSQPSRRVWHKWGPGLTFGSQP